MAYTTLCKHKNLLEGELSAFSTDDGEGESRFEESARYRDTMIDAGRGHLVRHL